MSGARPSTSTPSVRPAAPSTKRRAYRHRFGPDLAGIVMTPEEFDAIPDSDFVPHHRYELIRGVLVVSPPVSDAEADPNDELGYLLRFHKETSPQGWALDATMPERTVPTTTSHRRCDRAIWTGLGRLPDTKRDIPSIAIEFVSSHRRDIIRDYEQKRDEYLAAGVLEYWVIDRFRRIMTVYRPGTVGPTSLIVSETDIYRTDLLPGFELPLARLLARADRWRRKRTRKPPDPGAE